ncbi:MAG: cytochrome c oxidase subunit 3 [Gammaproteobacteria bacterium]|nr:cytochrome c oxidase subunit 3 [Gammaproteobacteria bacterium]
MTAITPAAQFDDLEQEHEASRLGMWTFLATEVLFFGVLFAAYAISRLLYPQGFIAASQHSDLMLGGIETAVLLTSSATMAMAARAIRHGRRTQALQMTLVTMALGAAFIVMHLQGYHHHIEEGLFPGVNFTYEGPYRNQVELFYFLYFVMTAFHLLHLIVGLCILAVIAVMTWREWFSPEYYTPVELTALYWDFVDIVWIFLFPSFYLISLA